MLKVLSFAFGIHLILLVYFTTYLTVKGLFGSKLIALLMTFVLFAKYLIYWKLLSIGLAFLNTYWTVIGFVSGLYLSLPILYFFNRKLNLLQENSELNNSEELLENKLETSSASS